MKEATLYVSVLALGIGCCASSALAEAQQAATQTDALTADEADLPRLDEVQIDSAEDEAGEESTPADGGAVSDDPPRSLFASARHAVAEINGEVHAFLDRIREIAQTHDPVYADEHRRVYEVRNPEGGTVLRLILERRRTRAGEGADTGGEDDQSALDDWVPDEVAMALDDAQDEA